MSFLSRQINLTIHHLTSPSVDLLHDQQKKRREGGGGRCGRYRQWERSYVDHRSWEALQEDESGLLRPIDTSAIYHAQYHRRLCMICTAAAGTRIQKGIIRYLYIVIDFFSD